MKTLYQKIEPFLARSIDDYLESPADKHRQICTALAKANGQKAITETQFQDLRWRVRKAISPHTVDLEDWLRSKNLLGTIAHLDADAQREQIQAYRHRWLEHLCNQYQLQEVFSKVATHLLAQKRISTLGRKCAYRGWDGLKCAVGCLIDDAHYKPVLEGHTVRDGELVQALVKSGVPIVPHMLDMLNRLQNLHDTTRPAAWATSLQKLAAKYGLEMPT